MMDLGIFQGFTDSGGFGAGNISLLGWIWREKFGFLGRFSSWDIGKINQIPGFDGGAAGAQKK